MVHKEIQIKQNKGNLIQLVSIYLQPRADICCGEEQTITRKNNQVDYITKTGRNPKIHEAERDSQSKGDTVRYTVIKQINNIENMCQNQNCSNYLM